jgi:prepilin-type N-terminal cleavage/methylation domain-containing protein
MERRGLHSHGNRDQEKLMIKRDDGFTLVELLITMVVFVFVISAASSVFTGLLTQFKQQSKIAETNIEGLVGLEVLRQDIATAGYGLPWNLNGVTYQEAVVVSVTPWVDRDFNDGPPDNPARGSEASGDSNPPGAIRSGNGYSINSSDVITIKAINIARNATCEKWTTLKANPSFTDVYNPRQWTPSTENLANNDKVIVVSVGTTSNPMVLMKNGTTFYTTYSNVVNAPWPPTDVSETRLVYGLTGSDVTTPRMPFNRADYYVRVPSSMPARCAPNTGILYKAVVSQVDGNLNNSELSLLDCVADMQVDFWLDTDGDGVINWPPSDDISALTAQQIRAQLKEVRVYIVAHEGQRDPNYDFSLDNTRTNFSATEVLNANSRTLNFVNLSTAIGNPAYKNYRWKLYTLVVKPDSLE